MTIQQVKEYFVDKEHRPCPLTEKLVIAGYQQISGGYIDRAKREGVLVDYTKNTPSQYWHLMSYCDSRDGSKPFSKSIICGELIFWMAETSGTVDNQVLEQLANMIIESADFSKDKRPVYGRKKWNREIQNICLDKIIATIYEKAQSAIEEQMRIIPVTDKELDDYLISQCWTRGDLTEEQLSSLRNDLEWEKSGGAILDGFLCLEKDLQQLRMQRMYSSLFVKPEEWDKLRSMIARCTWTFAKTMPRCPHEYIVRGKCPLSEEEFLYFIDMQRNYGKVERWGKYITPYLYVDDYKYWTMGAPVEETIVMNRAKVDIEKKQ